MRTVTITTRGECALVLVVAPGRIADRARPRLRSSAGTGHIHTSCVQVAPADILSAACGLARQRSLQAAPAVKPGHMTRLLTL
ncbi:hypothetical protein SAMN02745218_00902 [Desulfofundulus australicus DSM 11792]|uniref:Uncharacterized protein n=1 Tax=Desulfofundulus australicus DSM 11792 TaxID=1121425 RepID=A0A1M4WR90_9FIRM|nr:hypothetical protein [Desulfofundulus australicus]SHE83734.1 hypothetical protein SAMN02745218_00902 [Desulfofundulus australicus DSM 11792]